MTHLRSIHEVHLKQTGLEWTLCWAVVFKGIQKEGGARLDHVCFHKHVYDLVKQVKLLQYFDQNYNRANFK